jgi:hypothetical protein
MDDLGMSAKQPLLPGVVYDITIEDPKARIQANLDSYKSNDIPAVCDMKLAAMVPIRTFSLSKSALVCLIQAFLIEIDRWLICEYRLLI